MTIQIGIGFSQHYNATKAAQEAAEQAKKKLNQERIDLAIIFSTANYDPQEILPITYAILENTKLVGCSVAAIILPDRLETQGVGILLVNAEFTKFETGSVSYLTFQDIQLAGNMLAKNSITDFSEQHRKLLFYFVSNLLTNNTSFVKGIKERLGPNFPVLGVASSDAHNKPSFQFHNNIVIDQGASAVLFGGNVHWGASCKHGWRPLGKPRYIEKTDQNIIKTIDGQKAVSIYEEYFGAESQELNASPFGRINLRYPLGIYLEEEKEYLIRNVIKVNEDGSLVCQDEIPNGARVHLMIGSKDSFLESVRDATAKIKEQLQGRKAKMILVFESLKRCKLLGKTIWQEFQIIQNTLGEIAPVFGMCSDGEVFSFESGQTYLQNESILILAFC